MVSVDLKTSFAIVVGQFASAKKIRRSATNSTIYQLVADDWRHYCLFFIFVGGAADTWPFLFISNIIVMWWFLYSRGNARQML